MLDHPVLTKTELRAWYMYDWSNSVYSTVRQISCSHKWTSLIASVARTCAPVAIHCALTVTHFRVCCDPQSADLTRPLALSFFLFFFFFLFSFLFFGEETHRGTDIKLFTFSVFFWCALLLYIACNLAKSRRYLRHSICQKRLAIPTIYCALVNIRPLQSPPRVSDRL
jgi:hypothetical protein